MAPEIHGVLGFGGTGASVARALADEGREVAVWDDRPDARAAAGAAGFAVRPLEDGVALLLPSPGVPASHPAVRAARAAGVPVIGDIELLWRRRAGDGARFLAVSGTNGKSTVTALCAHLLEGAGVEAAAGGNLGPPALEMPRLGRGGVYVLEASSFQLELVDGFRADVAVLLNIAEDHLDRHGGRAGYVEAKRRLFRHQGPDETAVVGVDDADARASADLLEAAPEGPRVVRVSCGSEPAGGVWVRGSVLVDDLDGRAAEVADLDRALRIPGAHNRHNAACAYAAARAAGADAGRLAASLGGFAGLPHRLERVGEADGVAFYNDSKATNVAAAAASLRCFDRVCWIAGGRAKGEDLAPLADLAGRVERAFFVGESAPLLRKALAGRMAVGGAAELGDAVAEAFACARALPSRPPVLLAPACASYDRFPDFAARGEAFREAFRALAGGGER